MRGLPPGYLEASHHPKVCLYFLIPLLAVYEGGVFLLGAHDSLAVRSGADAWLRWLMHNVGLQALYWPPMLVAGVLAVWSWFRRSDRPRQPIAVVVGMYVESALLALGLLMLAQIQLPFLQVTTTASDWDREWLARAVGYLGAGIYEEFIFRLLLFPMLWGLLVLMETPWPFDVLGAMLLSAVVFAAAHHIGPYGEPLEGRVFCFRMLAGVYFAALLKLRGFGVTVGTHAFYDLFVGALMT